MMVMSELPASEMLFTASRTIAIEFDMRPITALKVARKIFAMIPMMLVLTIIFSRGVPPFSAFTIFSLFIIFSIKKICRKI